MIRRSSPALSPPALAAAVALACSLAACSGSSSDGAVSNKVSFTTFQDAAVVIGQPDFLTDDYPGTLSTTIGHTFGDPALVGNVLYLASWDQARVLAFRGVPTTNGAAADFAIGQGDLTSSVTDLSAGGMSGPQTVVAWGGKLFVDDYNNNRIAAYDAIPTGFGGVASFAIGQASLDVDPSTCDSATLSSPESFHIAAGKLLVSDSSHNRVLIWNAIPTASGAPADLVLGQQDFTSCVENDPVVAASTLSYPTGIWSDGTRVVVADTSNNRVLVWNHFPTRNGQPADLVLGQTSFSGDLENDPDTVGTAAGLHYPYFLDSNGEQLFVADNKNNRVLVWNTFPHEDGKRADVVLGQGSLDAIMSNDDDQDGLPDLHSSARTLAGPSGVKLIGKRLFVADGGNQRVLIFQGR